ncbi:MAG: hypothetical protein MRZ24_09380 [Clostridiales bacterium]|nr:hypothetical protein [Clostridiales bacterium]
MAKELNNNPEYQNSQKEPLSDRTVKVIEKDTDGLKHEHAELRAFQPDAVHQCPSFRFIRYDASENHINKLICRISKIIYALLSLRGKNSPWHKTLG